MTYEQKIDAAIAALEGLKGTEPMVPSYPTGDITGLAVIAALLLFGGIFLMFAKPPDKQDRPLMVIIGVVLALVSIVPAIEAAGMNNRWESAQVREHSTITDTVEWSLSKPSAK